MLTSKELAEFEALVFPMIPGGWFAGPPRLTADDDEILIVGTLTADGPGEGDTAAFRETTRAARMEIADRVQPATGRSVAWGVTSGGTTTVFTSLGIPVMTRLRIGEREVLDTLLAAGVARSRSEALAWCVRFVAQKEAELARGAAHLHRAGHQGSCRGAHAVLTSVRPRAGVGVGVQMVVTARVATPRHPSGLVPRRRT